MDSFLFQLTRALIFIASTYGIGSFVNRFLNKDDDGYGISFCVGIVTWLAIGGPLIALNLAGQNTLILLQIFGLVVLIKSLASRKVKQSSQYLVSTTQSNLQQYLAVNQFSHSQIVNGLFSVLVLVLLCFLIYYLMPSYVLNYHDDFHVYLLPIVQIIETGTFSINHLDNATINTFGGLPFLQALSLVEYRTQDVNLFDAIICYCAVLVLLYEYGIKHSTDKRVILLAIVLFISINPQYVNISALFSTTLLVLALLISCLKLNAHYLENEKKSLKIDLKLHFLVALFLMGTLLLKHSSAPFLLVCIKL